MDPLEVGGYLIEEEELEERFETSGGPGGQHANRSATAVVLRFDVEASSLPGPAKELIRSRLGPVVQVTAADSRSQARNRRIARDRMALALSEALVVRRKRKRTKPTRASKEKRRRDKQARADTKRHRRRPTDD